MKNLLNHRLLYFIVIILVSCKVIPVKQDTFAQNVANIKEMPYIPELSGDTTYWEIVKGGIDTIPMLIKHLDDTTKTQAPVPNFGGYYTVGDVCWSAILKIIRDVPTNQFIPKDITYWMFVRESRKNRKILKRKFKKWFYQNKDKLIWVKDTMRYRTPQDWKYPNNLNPAGGYFIIENRKSKK